MKMTKIKRLNFLAQGDLINFKCMSLVDHLNFDLIEIKCIVLNVHLNVGQAGFIEVLRIDDFSRKVITACYYKSTECFELSHVDVGQI